MQKVSVIIPYHNVEDYIEECLKSVLNQTLEDIEIIMVNDASTDNTPNIVRQYAEKDSRIKLLDLPERKGQGYARNRAIEIAKGEYIGFVDSDDFIEKNMFELLYKNAKENRTDITMCQAREYDDLNEKYISSDYYSLAPLTSFKDNVFSAENTKEIVLDINVALWNKIYSRYYLTKIGEKFPEGFIYEDLPFFFGTYLPAKRIHIVWEHLYNYRVNRKNSTMQQFNNKILDRLPMVSLTYEKIKETEYLNDSKQKIQGWIINDLFHRYTLLKENYHKEFFFNMKKVFQSLEIEDINNDYWKKVYHFEGYLLVMNNSFEEFSQKVFSEYLDIHKVEDRLRSEITNSKELDRRFELLYTDLNKSYKYTEELDNALKTDLTAKLKESTKNLYNDIKDLTFVVHDNFIELNKEQYQIKEIQEKIISENNNLKNYSEENFNKIKENYKTYTNSRIEILSEDIRNTESNIQNKINELEKKLLEEKSKSLVIITNLKNDFENIFKEQQIKHEEEISFLKAKMETMEQKLREEMKSPIKKLIEKCSNKQEK